MCCSAFIMTATSAPSVDAAVTIELAPSSSSLTEHVSLPPSPALASPALLWR
jgi:hypothetical protein